MLKRKRRKTLEEEEKPSTHFLTRERRAIAVRREGKELQVCRHSRRSWSMPVDAPDQVFSQLSSYVNTVQADIWGRRSTLGLLKTGHWMSEAQYRAFAGSPVSIEGGER